jgi:multisubunit Na+/H+ antiporter MnhB subunit
MDRNLEGKMSNRLWGAFAALMIGTATVLYLLGFRWYDHDVNAVGAVVILVIMASLMIRERSGRPK